MNYFQRFAIISCTVTFLILVNSASFLLASEIWIDTLHGLKGVGLEIADLPAEIDKNRLSKHQIQIDVELKLRMAGIDVLSDKKLSETEGFPYLFVRVACVDLRNIVNNLGTEYYICSINVELRENVF